MIRSAPGETQSIVHLSCGVPADAGPFRGLVYRQAVEHLQGLRDGLATRELIIRENRRYARRQLIWFRKAPNLQWIHLPGEEEGAFAATLRLLEAVARRS